MKNFDSFIGIDWSGALSPVHTKSIAVAQCERGQSAPIIVKNAHKYWSRMDVGAWVKSLAYDDKRILIGIDANFGYAREVARKQLGENYNAQDLWYHVENICKGDDNYFAGKFWNNYLEHFWTSGKRPDHITLPKREIENACGESGYGWPESPFKLIGPKQVGKGGLATMRMAHDLKASCGDKICIWPFEREIQDSAIIVISEIYPRQFLKRCGHGNSKIQNIEDLNTALRYFNSEELNGLSRVDDHLTDALVAAAGLRWLCGNGDKLPSDISNSHRLTKDIAKTEGWIFGV